MKKSNRNKAILMFRKIKKIFPVLLLPLITQCQQKTSGTNSYDFTNPQVIQLSGELKEISGIVYQNNSLYAITDNSGDLFKLDPASGKIIDRWKFAKTANYEDVAFFNNKFYVLNSNGDIISFDSPGNEKVISQEFKFPFGKGNEFEILYYDDKINQLVMICKGCKDDKKKSLSVYTINPVSGKYTPAGFVIDAEAVIKKLDSKSERLKPSAAAIHPATGEVYMISSINKALIRLNRNGKVLSVTPFKRSLFEQPEGIAFNASGDMLISNESGKKANAVILVFKKSSQ